MVIQRAAAADPEAAIWAALAEVPDPEIPTISVVDLGVIGSVELADDRSTLRVELMPTFIGCPATEVMRQAIRERLGALGLAGRVDVELTFAEPWTSDRITAAGREQLRSSGFAPPPPLRDLTTLGELPTLTVVPCPYCGSRQTTLENPFGPTLCRAIYHCAGCRQPFEAFKPI
ncbi:MAG: phenylacetate-CoA oxygenase subunit PaaJ [Chloroflexi bacterium]|nr:MAG: phenylacetate-CoA oxygenase subunit PaaJ [Chloroflexota bacterium]